MHRLTTLATAAAVFVPALAQAAFVDDFSTDANLDPRDNSGTETIDVTTTGTTVELTFNNNFPVAETGGPFTPIDYFPGARDSPSLSPQPSATRFDLVNEGILTMTNVQLINPDGEDDVPWALRAFYFGPDDSDGTPDTDTDDDFLGNLVLQGNSLTTGNLRFDVLDQAQTEGGVYANAT